MPTLKQRRKRRLRKAKNVQRRALRIQRGRVKRFRNLRAVIRRTRSKIGKRRREIQALERRLADGPVTIIGGGGPGNIRGGTPEQRLVAVATKAALMHAKGIRKSFYSQTGYWDYKHAIMGEPPGARSDCSSWWIACYWAAGLPDPTGYNFRGGFTGTIGAAGRRVWAPGSPGGAGLYGSGNYFHVEMSLGDGRYIGHGSPPVDYQTPGAPDVHREYV